MSKREHSWPARLFGYFLVVASVAVLALASWDMYTKITRQNSRAVVPHLTQVAPLDQAWRLDLPKTLLDPRSMQSWQMPDGQLAALISGTDGKKNTQVVTKLDGASGKATWNIAPQNYLDYCLHQLWNGQIVCESKAAKKIVTINDQGQETAHDLPFWDNATGEHVLGGVIDHFLAVPIATAEGNSAGTHVMYLNPDFSYKGRFPIMVRGATGAEPLPTAMHGAMALSGAHTSDGTSENYTWSYALMLNSKIGLLDTAKLGPEPQAALLDNGFFATGTETTQGPATDEGPSTAEGPAPTAPSSHANAPAASVPWQVYKADGTMQAQGSTFVAPAQALVAQSRQGHLVSTDTAVQVLQSNQVAVILPDSSLVTTTDLKDCPAWTDCAAKEWQAEGGKTMTLPYAGLPVLQDGSATVFRLANGLAAVGNADGKNLWSGIVPPIKGAVATREITTLGNTLVTLAQMGSTKDPQAHAALIAWKLPA